MSTIVFGVIVCLVPRQAFNSPEACAASAAILHKLMALIQVDSKRLHLSSLSLTYWTKIESKLNIMDVLCVFL